MTADKQEEEAFWFDFIECYRLCPALWDSKYRGNGQRKVIDQQVLLEKYRERFPDASLKQMLRKVHSLRSNHRRETKRLMNLNKYGPGHISNLWYFNAMSFINDNEPKHLSKNSLSSSEIEHQIKRSHSSEGIEIDDDFDKLEESSSFLYADESFIEEFSQPKFGPPRKKSRICRKTKKRISKDPIQCSTLTVDTSPQECGKIVELWALKLQKMHPKQQLLSEKFVNEILFEGQMGTLHRNSLQLNTPKVDEYAEAQESG